ncbi:MAG: YeeE/YedE family protein [Chloroflexota bacterium]
MGIGLAIVAGVLLGYIFERGDFCFHSTMRGLFRRPRQLDLFRAYLLTLLIAIPLVQGMMALGWIEPWVAPFAWPAAIFGGLIFGAGMVVASTCITGLFYKLGHGMLGVLVALITWAIGDIMVYRGPLSGLRDWLNATQVSVDGTSATVINLLGTSGLVLLAVLAIGMIFFLLRSPAGDRDKLWSWLPLGIATGLFTSFAWLLADWGGSNYTYGTSSVPTQLYLSLTAGDALWSPWIVISLVSLVPGAFVAAYLSGTLWVRGESLMRYTELAAGGLLMGVGAGIAGGCNLGHSLVGVPLLSMGSIATTLSMVVGLFITHRLMEMRSETSAHAPDPEPQIT